MVMTSLASQARLRARNANCALHHAGIHPIQGIPRLRKRRLCTPSPTHQITHHSSYALVNVSVYTGFQQSPAHSSSLGFLHPYRIRLSRTTESLAPRRASVGLTNNRIQKKIWYLFGAGVKLRSPV
ncbi:hypothetical protein H112_01044 [Trichophyton rubrum D6]|uniref:Uncharacterized protein n=3 Tax=Trichophyton TaxID=5550 RepID=A0A080WLX3_TRIRC|nr:uncharacterized protein TERG_12550 [Trichophyton rubrum CBS 118892]EZF26860.1 hypothetical protein H100_01043 [Trichophyton rubrum MR850]EZF45926.1 hypothetical protein H102_01034 [Trichophyton rubrum CBS 100081]EZF56533.1 hypothetical protein H103_01042 [Trichophyton rubrum CBS 288.86]EZF67159.1 hypothetical protein H104_01027 [Trichophyton rubrum CBS 289.86]EZF77759.1 hypothetical protein H105_01044 [Trichophyton soudanense CBS 452.61]EZF99282.1 hypothetical protein H113_01045 [Trichophy